MNLIEKPSAAWLAAEALREMLRTGALEGTLPGTRILAERLGLSAPTVATALDRLAAEGLVESGGSRRAYRIPAGATALPGASGAAPQVVKDLLILTHEESGRLVDSTRRLLELMQWKLGKRQWRVRNQVINFLHVNQAQTGWNRKIEVDEGTRVIAVYGQQALAEWAVERNVKMLFLGGDSGGLPVPKVAVSSARMAETAMSRLLTLGHRRIVLPLCDRAEGFKEAMREVTRRAVEKAGDSYIKSYHNPESGYLAPDVTWRMMASMFATQPPTALVFIDWMELVTAYCFLTQAGLKVPQDVSLVVLSDSITAEWFYPKLCRFRFPQNRLLAEMIKWLEAKPGSEKGAVLSGAFVAGESMGPPRDSGA